MDEHDGSISSSSSSGISTSSSSSSGLQVSTMGDAEESEELETFEGVTSDEFHEAVDIFSLYMDAQIAASVVIVFTLFVCAGVLAVDTLVRSLEG